MIGWIHGMVALDTTMTGRGEDCDSIPKTFPIPSTTGLLMFILSLDFRSQFKRMANRRKSVEVVRAAGIGVSITNRQLEHDLELLKKAVGGKNRPAIQAIADIERAILEKEQHTQSLSDEKQSMQREMNTLMSERASWSERLQMAREDLANRDLEFRMLVSQNTILKNDLANVNALVATISGVASKYSDEPQVSTPAICNSPNASMRAPLAPVASERVSGAGESSTQPMVTSKSSGQCEASSPGKDTQRVIPPRRLLEEQIENGPAEQNEGEPTETEQSEAGEDTSDKPDSAAVPAKKKRGEHRKAAIKAAASYTETMTPLYRTNEGVVVAKTSGKRTRIEWTPEEEALLRRGVKVHGLGAWRQILEGGAFHPKRTSVHLKDKYRNMVCQPNH